MQHASPQSSFVDTTCPAITGVASFEVKEIAPLGRKMIGGPGVKPHGYGRPTYRKPTGNPLPLGSSLSLYRYRVIFVPITSRLRHGAYANSHMVVYLRRLRVCQGLASLL